MALTGIALGAGLVLLQAVVPIAVRASPTCGGGQASDFDGDGHNDLAVGVPYRDVGTAEDAGAVVMIRGSSEGLRTAGSEFLTTQDANVQPEDGNHWGWALVVGDFDGDEYADLAVGMPHDDIDAIVDGGAVIVFYGSLTGLEDPDAFVQGRDGIEGTAERFDGFGRSLAAGDLDGDGYCDLAIGVPGQDVGLVNAAGAVHVIYGSATGLTATGDQIFDRDTPGVAGSAETSAGFGHALSAANVGKSGHHDLVVGVPAHDVGAKVDAGAVHVLYGSASGITADGDRVWHRDSAGVAGSAQPYAGFGIALTAGDFGKTRHADIVVGAFGQDIGGVEDAGSIHAFYGSATGLTADGGQVWHQDSVGILGSAEESDLFGHALTAGNFGMSRHADVAIGLPGQDVNGHQEAGAVHVLHGSPTGLTATGDQVWTQDTPGMVDAAQTQDRFGYALMAANLGSDPRADLAVGVPFQDDLGDGGDPDVGAVHAIYGSSTGLVVTENERWFQATTGLGAGEFEDLFGAALGRIR